MSANKLYRTETAFRALNGEGREFLFQFYLTGEGNHWLVLFAYLFDPQTKEFVGLFTPKHIAPDVDGFMGLAVKELLGIVPLATPSLPPGNDAPIEAILPLDF